MRQGGASDERSSSPQPSLSPATPKLAPRPLSHPGPDHRHCHPPLPPTRAKPRPPRLVPPGRDLRPPHPCQELRKPPRRPPLPLLPTVTTMPTTSTCRSHEGSIAGGRQAAGYPVRVVVVPATQGEGGEGRRTQRPVAPGIAQLISQTVVSLS